MQGLLASAIIIVFILSMFIYIQKQLQEANDALIVQRLNLINSRIIGIIEHNSGWRVTQNYQLNKPDFECLNTNTCPDQWKPFNLLDVEGNITISEGGDRFSLDGSKCKENDFQKISYLCPFLYQVKWKPDCVSCKQSIRVSADLTIDEKLKTIINPSNYKVDFIRGQIEGTLASQCHAMGGQISIDDSSQCVLPITSRAACPPGFYLNGVDSAGNHVCNSISAIYQRCSRGVATIRPNGSLACN